MTSFKIFIIKSLLFLGQRTFIGRGKLRLLIIKIIEIIIFNNSIKKFYNSVMMRSDLIIAGSNFIFSHIKENYAKYLNTKKKLLVIFRGINVDYFDSTTKLESDEKKLLKKWEIEKDKKIILLPGRLTEWKGQEVFIEAVNLVNIELGYEAFYAVILGSDQGRDLYKKKLIRLTEQYRMTKQVGT